jgi:hypothetical protein
VNRRKVEANCCRNSDRALELHPASLRKTAINDAI